MPEPPVINFRGVSKHFGSFRALNEVSFQVSRGERVVVCGPSGSGKSTLIRCINGLEQHDAGDIEVFGQPLSGGQQQRVAIARSLCMSPEIMLFDEPTSALDPEMINEVLEVMVELASSGMTMICVTHEMGFARRVADTMVFMDHGEIVESGEPTVFFSHPRSRRCRDFLQKILQH